MSFFPGMLAIAAVVTAAVTISAADGRRPPPQGGAQVPWGRCCGMGPWPQAPGMGHGMTGPRGHGMMGQGHASMARHRAAMMGGVPAPYTDLGNPLPRTRATLELGRSVYAANCASCHGETGAGDGPAARGLSPAPADLAWLSNMPMSRWDPYMYWTVAEGGAPFGTAMPSFKQTLSEQETWAVIAYVQARLPQSPLPQSPPK